MNDKETIRKIRRMAKDGKVKFAPSFEIEPYLPALHDLLRKIDACEEPERGFFSDESCLSDFGDDALALRVREIYGIQCEPRDSLLDIVKRLGNTAAK